MPFDRYGIVTETDCTDGVIVEQSPWANINTWHGARRSRDHQGAGTYKLPSTCHSLVEKDDSNSTGLNQRRRQPLQKPRIT